jgi:hypothetical protein
MEKSEETGEIHIQFLYPHGRGACLIYPVQLHELNLVNHILSLHTATSETGRTYKLTSAENNHASKLLNDFNRKVHEM